jgi:hypothetical protein
MIANTLLSYTLIYAGQSASRIDVQVNFTIVRKFEIY